jgi:hypothetical protein
MSTWSPNTHSHARRGLCWGKKVLSPSSHSAVISRNQRQPLMGGWGIAQRCPSMASTGAPLRYAPATHWRNPLAATRNATLTVQGTLRKQAENESYQHFSANSAAQR